MLRFGVPETIARKITGHKTRAMYDRYCIVAEDDLAKAMGKLEAGRQAERELAALEAQKTVENERDSSSLVNALVNATASKLPS